MGHEPESRQRKRWPAVALAGLAMLLAAAAALALWGWVELA